MHVIWDSAMLLVLEGYMFQGAKQVHLKLKLRECEHFQTERFRGILHRKAQEAHRYLRPIRKLIRRNKLHA